MGPIGQLGAKTSVKLYVWAFLGNRKHPCWRAAPEKNAIRLVVRVPKDQFGPLLAAKWPMAKAFRKFGPKPGGCDTLYVGIHTTQV